MTSPKKVAANRLNGRNSRGPRTAAGIARASRNARRHGLAAFRSHDDPAMAAQLVDIVGAICADDRDPLLREQAILIAENQLWLSCIKREKVALIERLRDATAMALTSKVRVARGRARLRLVHIADAQQKKVSALMEQATAAGRDPEHEPLPPKLQAAWPPAWIKAECDGDERDDYEALHEGIHDLMRLQRYERRAWSQRKAIRAFMAIKLSKAI